MDQSKFFKTQKKVNPNLFLDEGIISFRADTKFLSKINKCIIELFEFNEKKKFKNILEIKNFLNKTNFYKLNKNINIMTKIEKIVYNYFYKKKIINKDIHGIQYPMDIRIIHPLEPKKLKSKKYLTSSIHCDTWTEEPPDIINVIMYLVVNKNTSRVSLLETNEKELLEYSKYQNFYKNKFFLYSKKYFSILNKLKLKKPNKIKHVNGQILIFNGYVPHQTVRKGNEVRISLEFRLKTKNPYKETKNWKNTNNHGRYWLLPNGIDDNFSKRIKNEKIKINKMKDSKNLINLRNKEIKKNETFQNF